MPNYLLSAGGNVGGGFSWSTNWICSSSNSESAVATAWAGGWTACWAVTGFPAEFGTTVTLTYASASTATATFKQTTKTTETLDLAGTATSSLPPQIATIVTWRTGEATKWGRGRWYLPPVAQGAINDDGTNINVADMTTLVNGINAGLTTWLGTFTPQILHRHNTLSGPAADTLTPITSGDVSNKVAVQKRRGDKFVPARTDLTF